MLAWGIAPGNKTMCQRALKARFNPAERSHLSRSCAGSESRFQRWRFFAGVNPGALPQAHAERCAFGAKHRGKGRGGPCRRDMLVETPVETDCPDTISSPAELMINFIA